MQTKHLLTYPQHSEFEELLNSCGSMTKQLEALGHKLHVELIAECINGEYFSRYTILRLNQQAVVIACSQALITDDFFYSLLANASTQPIGKFLFAANSLVVRNPNMVIESVNSKEILHQPLQQYLQQKYQPEQQFWSRKSCFEFETQQLSLVEIILPELDNFF